MSTVPSQWKTASVKLIGKQAAQDDPTLPSNFRPIALTSCVGKLFTTILCRRWLSFMLSNKYLDKGIQKAFMPRTPGCIEHHLKLATVLQDARKKHRSLAVCWLDLANAYGSVHHSLITFSLQHYHAPPKFFHLVQNFYSNLSATINSAQWSTSPIPQEVGVYQGDPLSVVIFNTVINTLVDIRSKPELGYHLTNNQSISLLQYADDTCLIANSPSSCQHLLQFVDRWLSWSGMRAKVPKCHCLALKASSGKLVDPQLTIAGQQIPVAPDSVKFLGKIFQVPHDSNRVRESITSHLLRMLESVNSCPLTRGQKLKLYRAGICPRLSWLLMIEDLPISWVEKKLDSLATLYLKKWAGLARPANPAVLYLPHKMGGLNLPLVSVQYKRLQVVKQSQLLTSVDHCTRQIAERSLQRDLSLERAKFRPSVVVRDVMVGNPDINRKSLARGAKLMVQEEACEERHKRLLSLEREGQMFRCTSSDAAATWGQALMELSDEHRKFAINSAVDTLPHNANLRLWRKRNDDACPLCGDRQTLIHVLNACPVALQARRYNHRHDAVLRKIVAVVSDHLLPTETLTSDISDYQFPHHIVPTSSRPDIVWWDDTKKKLSLVELTICFETSFDGAAERKQAKYVELQQRAQEKGFRTSLITVEVGSRGIINNPGFTRLKKELCLSDRWIL